MKNSALDYLAKQANAWRRGDYYSEIEQSYRLYVLALAGKPNMAAMNRMKEDTYKNPIARWQLAGAYALGKHEKIAKALIANLPAEAELYRQLGRCYGSDLRDNAIIMQSMINMDMKDEAYKLMQKMARKFASNEWLSTQESAFGLCAIGNYVERYFKDGNGIDVQIGKDTYKTTKTVLQKELVVKNNKSEVTVKNNSSGTLHGTDNVDIRDDRAYLYFSLKQGQSKTFKLRFNAAYSGTYLLPAITCSAMYDNSITATLPGNTITINRE